MRFVFALVLLIWLNACSTLGVGHYSDDYFRSNYLDETSRYLVSGDFGVHLRVEGPPDGEPVLLLHGFLASLHTWDGWVEKLSKDYRVYRLDLPGFGFSTLPEDKDIYRVDSPYLAELIDTFLDEFNVDRVHLAGNSLGGYIAWKYAAERPEKVRTLALLNAVSYPQELPGVLKLGSNPVLNTLSGYALPDLFIKHGVKQVYGVPERLRPTDQKRYADLMMYKGNRRNFALALRSLNRAASDPGLANGLSDVVAPTLVVWGGRDRWVPVEFAERLNADIDNSTVIMYENAGHVPMEEIPDRSVSDYMKFLDTY